MAQRIIGVEIAPGTVRVAVLGRHRGAMTVIALEQRPCAAPGELPEVLAALIPGGFQLADRVITALPAGSAFTRTLHFPFRERRKIYAAVPLALAAQLPVPLDERQVVATTPQGSADGASTMAAAVSRKELEELLALFDGSRTPLHLVDLLPTALAAGAGEAVGTGLVACLTEQETLLTGIRAGRLVDYQQLPRGEAHAAGDLPGEIAQATLRFGGEAGPLLLTGALATVELCERLSAAGVPAGLLELSVGARRIPAAFVPAVALALRAGRQDDGHNLNLRQGRYAYRGETAVLRRILLGMGSLLALSLLLFALASALTYRDASRQAQTLQELMVSTYRESFPGSQLTVDPALQMESKVVELRNRAAALGIGAAPQLLPILRELAGSIERVPFAVEALSCDESACALTASTDSFDAVNRAKELLGTSPRFSRAEVTETRKAVDGQSVEFRLHLPLKTTGGPL